MSGFLDVFRFAVTGQTAFSWLGFGWSVVSAIAIFCLGTWIFRSAEEGFADYI
jgi:lipopolysaccharide transport system permease protein